MDIFSCSSKLVVQKTNDPKNMKEYQYHKGLISDLCISENQRVIASCGYDGYVYLTNIETQNILQQFRQKQQINSLSFNIGSQMLATGNEYQLIVYDIKRKKPFYQEDVDSNVNQVIFNKQEHNELMAACTSDGDCHLYSKEEQQYKQLQRICQQVGIECLQFNKQHKNILVQGLENGIIDVFDINGKKQMFETSQRHQKKVNCILFSPFNSAFMMSVSDDHFIKFHDINSNKFIKQIYIEDKPLCADFHNNGHSIVIGTRNGSVLVYDLRKDKNRMLIHQHPQSVNQVKFLYPTQSQQSRHHFQSFHQNTEDQTTPKIKQTKSNSSFKTNHSQQKYTEKENNLTQNQQISDPPITKFPAPVDKQTIQNLQNTFTKEQKQYIQQIIDSSNQEIREQMEESFKNIHLEMIRQFQIQSNQMTQIIQQQLEQQKQLQQKNKQLQEQLAIVQNKNSK